MGERRVLIIGSQCKKHNHLSFLPEVAEALYAVMTDPELGECVPALESGGLLLDPSVDHRHTHAPARLIVSTNPTMAPADDSPAQIDRRG